MNDNSFVFELDAQDKPINGRRGYLALMKDSRTERLIVGSNLLSVSSSLSNRCVPTEKETTHIHGYETTGLNENKVTIWGNRSEN